MCALPCQAGKIRLVAFMLACMLPLAHVAAQEQPAGKPPADSVEQILLCLRKGEEAVLFPNAVICIGYRRGVDYLENIQRQRKDIEAFQGQQLPKEGLPEVPSPLESCNNKSDMRRLAADTIKKIAGEDLSRFGKAGIRIIGAIFCDRLDLVGLNLPYSLVIDRSLFQKGIEARNLHVQGDLSLDQSLVFDSLRLTRARVDGSVFASDGAMQTLQILDSDIRGSVILRHSHLFKLVSVDGSTISSELSVRDSRLSYLLVQFSRIGGFLDLSGSEARCAYHVRKSDIGDVVAVKAGFGDSTPSRAPGKRLYKWALNPLPETPMSRVAVRSDIIRAAGESEECSHVTPSFFALYDSRIRASLCMRSFHWLKLGGADQDPVESSIRIHDLKVDGTIQLDTNTTSDRPFGDSKYATRRLELIGVDTHHLLLNFRNEAHPDLVYVNWIRFDRWDSAWGSCGYEPGYSAGAGENLDDNGPGRGEGFIGGLRSASRPPVVNEVADWLEVNKLRALEPYTAFADVFQKAGDDNGAKRLRILRARTELWAKTCDLFPPLRHLLPRCRTSEASISPERSTFSEAFTVAGGWVLRLLAGHGGYRPERVLWFVLGFLLLFFVIFWAVLRTVAYMPVDKATLRPIGFMFLFDRMLPLYRIREEHYQIKDFYVTLSEQKAARRPSALNPKLRYFHLTLPVYKADERETRRASILLDWLKVIGVILAIFLAAAVKALVAN